MKVTQAVLAALAKNAHITDIMVQSEDTIMVKTARGWSDAGTGEKITYKEIFELLLAIEPDAEQLITKGEINRPHQIEGHRLRINAYLANAGKRLMLSMRRIPSEMPTLQKQGLPGGLRVLLDTPSGLLLISGPTGSGKTSSMAAMVDAINQSRAVHVVTVEEPIEYVFERKNAIFSQREVGVDCDSVLDGVRAALRQRPDVIVIGEIRDRETAEQALIAGESGHLVIGTLHASSALHTVTKMLAFFSDTEQEAKSRSLAASLLGVVNQTLIPRADGGGYALAVDFLANHKRTYSKHFGDADKMNAMMERKEDGVSIPLGDSIQALIRQGVISKADAVRAVAGNPSAYDRVRA